jgi:hypothetical protein
VVIQKIDNDIFKLLPEQLFSKQLLTSITCLEESEDEESTKSALSNVVKIANITPEKLIENEFVKLSKGTYISERLIKNTGINKRHESVPFFFAKYSKNCL